jgi:hypothetical protein
MRNLRNILHWFSERIHNYNLFILEEDDYDDDDHNAEDPVVVVKHQKYTTWWYLLFLIGKQNMNLFTLQIKSNTI